MAARRATFDTDNIDIGPERRDYLDHRLSRVWEMNSQVLSPDTPGCTCVGAGREVHRLGEARSVPCYASQRLPWQAGAWVF